MKLEHIRSLKCAAISARPMYYVGCQSPEAQELEKAWDEFYGALYRAETAAMAACMQEGAK